MARDKREGKRSKGRDERKGMEREKKTVVGV